MANVNDRIALPELAIDRELAPQIYYDSHTDTLVVSLYGPPEAGMNVPVDDAGIDLRVSLDERELLGFEISGFTSSFLPLQPQYLDFAASAGVASDEIQHLRARISTTQRQKSAIDSLLRQFAGVSLGQ